MRAKLHRIHFMGRVHPKGFTVNGSYPLIGYKSDDGMISANFSVRIVDSAIDIRCDFDNILHRHPYELWTQAQEITQTLVNLIAYSHGAGAITVIDEWINQDGVRNNLPLADNALPPLCTALEDKTFDPVMRIVFSQPPLFIALNDLILANVMPRHVILNCARAVETIRNLVAVGIDDRGQAWGIMQNTLNFDRPYRELITTHSIAPRHGDHRPADDRTILEVRARSWKIMDRYLHFRLNDGQQLPHNLFPILRG